MRLSVPAFFLAAAGTSATATANDASRNYLPTTHVRSLAVKSLHMAQSRALATRKLDDFDLGDIGALLCNFLPQVTQDPTFAAELEKVGLTCSDYKCSADSKKLIVNCSMAGPTCEVDFDGTEYCVKDTSVGFTMGLDFEGESEIVSKQCSVYTKPEELAGLGQGCINLSATIDFGGIIMAVTDAVMSGEADDLSEEEAAKLALEYFDIDECSGEFKEAGVTCNCGICDEGIGFTLTCNDNMGIPAYSSEQCTDYDTGAISSFGSMGGGSTGTAAGPGVSIVKLSSVTSDVPDVIVPENFPDMSDVKDAGAAAAAAMGDSPAPTVASSYPLAAGLVLALAYNCFAVM